MLVLVILLSLCNAPCFVCVRAGMLLTKNVVNTGGFVLIYDGV